MDIACLPYGNVDTQYSHGSGFMYNEDALACVFVAKRAQARRTQRGKQDEIEKTEFELTPFIFLTSLSFHLSSLLPGEVS